MAAALNGISCEVDIVGPSGTRRSSSSRISSRAMPASAKRRVVSPLASRISPSSRCSVSMLAESELTRLVAGKEEDAPRPFGKTLEHEHPPQSWRNTGEKTKFLYPERGYESVLLSRLALFTVRQGRRRHRRHRRAVRRHGRRAGRRRRRSRHRRPQRRKGQGAARKDRRRRRHKPGFTPPKRPARRRSRRLLAAVLAALRPGRHRRQRRGHQLRHAVFRHQPKKSSTGSSAST